MRNVRAIGRAARGDVDDDRRWFVLQALGWSHRDAVGFIVATFLTGAILVNVLFMQVGPHPAPMFNGGLPLASIAANGTTDPARTRVRTVGPAAPKAEPQQAAVRASPSNAKGAKAASAPPSVPASAAAPTTTTTGAAPRPTHLVRSDPIAELLARSRRVLAVQRALAEFGYGQIKPTGIVDAETRAAIEKFERERKLPITGTASDRVARELAAITGRPME